MAFRAYREKDLPDLVAFVNEAFQTSYEFIPYTEEKLRVELAEATAVLLGVDEQDRTLGLAWLFREWYGEEIMLCV